MHRNDHDKDIIKALINIEKELMKQTALSREHTVLLKEIAASLAKNPLKAARLVLKLGTPVPSIN